MSIYRNNFFNSWLHYCSDLSFFSFHRSGMKPPLEARHRCVKVSGNISSTNVPTIFTSSWQCHRLQTRWEHAAETFQVQTAYLFTSIEPAPDGGNNVPYQSNEFNGFQLKSNQWLWKLRNGPVFESLRGSFSNYTILNNDRVKQNECRVWTKIEDAASKTRVFLASQIKTIAMSLYSRDGENGPWHLYFTTGPPDLLNKEYYTNHFWKYILFYWPGSQWLNIIIFLWI